MMRFALTYTRLRVEERLLLDAFEELGIEVEPIDLRSVVFNPASAGEWDRFDAVLDRCVSLTTSLTAHRILESFGLRCINRTETVDVCSDKLRTTLALSGAGVPSPGVRLACSTDAGLEAIEAIGYPAVLKPTVGSWGRLVARVNDRDAAEALLEHRDSLGSTSQKVVYAQEHIEKPGRDIRAFVIGDRTVAAIVRSSAHWVTNTARGATAEGFEVTDELAVLCERAAAAVGGDAVAVDLLECPDRGLLVNEINHSMEFRNSIETTGVNIPRLIAEHTVRVAEESQAGALA